MGMNSSKAKQAAAKRAKPLPPGNYTATVATVKESKGRVAMTFNVNEQAANPKDSIGRTKVPLSLVPMIAIAEESLAFLEGKLKYGEVNWREAPVYLSVYLDALMRHIQKYSEGEDRDPITKVHHLGNARACSGIILDAAAYGTLIDDRKMSNGAAIELVDDLVDNVKFLTELFADKNPKHYKITDSKPLVASRLVAFGSKGRNQ